MNRHASHAWDGRRCANCGSLDSWPLAEQRCQLAGTTDGDMGKGRRVLSDEDVRSLYGRVQSGELRLTEAARIAGVHYSAIWRRARKLGMGPVQQHTSHDWPAILPRVRAMRATGRSVMSIASEIGIANGVLARKLKEAAS